MAENRQKFIYCLFCQALRLGVAAFNNKPDALPDRLRGVVCKKGLLNMLLVCLGAWWQYKLRQASKGRHSLARFQLRQ
jgi:hypothetical protein